MYSYVDELTAELSDMRRQQVTRMVEVVDEWVDEERAKDGSVQPGVLATGLVIADHVRGQLPLTEHDVSVSSQIRGQSGDRVHSILRRFGEERRFLSEGGRTSRNSKARGVELARRLSDAVTALSNSDWHVTHREIAADAMQEHLVRLVQRDYFDKKRLTPDISTQLTVGASVQSLLSEARSRSGSAAGAVAQHLVGAALEERLPDVVIGSESYSTSDQQTARPGDFLVGDTAIHVTMSPGDRVFSDRCSQNLQAGLRPLVLVPEQSVVAALQLAANVGLVGSVVVNSIESFIAASLEEASGYEGTEARQRLRGLFERYNERVARIEPDPSLLIDLG
ncbi:DUF4928 domain-containing protein [Microbacterium foliorum]|nr:DUF4928 family protein [Microbacterium foliorum]AXL10747.1 DUF4928 domain-containing protein [Microbacterium foliorum]